MAIILNFFIVFLFSIANCSGNRGTPSMENSSQKSVIAKLEPTTIPQELSHEISKQRNHTSLITKHPRIQRAHTYIETNYTSPNTMHQNKWHGIGSEFAGVVIEGSFYSVYTKISVFKPRVEQGHFSSISVVIETGYANAFNQIEAGWIVDPDFYGDYEPHLFIKSQVGVAGINYHDLCYYFVAFNGSIKVGDTLKPSKVGWDPQETLELSLIKDEELKTWFLRGTNNEIIGYWKPEIFTSLQENATKIRFNGEVFTPPSSETSPPMGSGLFENGIPSTTCHFSEIQVNEDDQDSDPKDPWIKETRCYYVGLVGKSDRVKGYGFFIGGTGGKDRGTCFY